MGKSNSFKLPDVKAQIENLSHKKYSFGDKANKLNEIKQSTPVFAFNYISLENSDFCFNSKLINGVKEYIRILNGLKRISDKSYDELSTDRSYHLHEVEFKDTSISEAEFIKCIVPDINKVHRDHCPTAYQFKIFEEARIFGFVARGVFYFVFFDRNHNGYKRK